jgi:hypothetical protein
MLAEELLDMHKIISGGDNYQNNVGISNSQVIDDVQQKSVQFL